MGGGQFTGTDKGNANLTVTDGTTTGYGINSITVSSGDVSSTANGAITIDTSGSGGSGTVTSITPDGDSGTGTAITTSGTIDVAGGTNITTSVSGTTITVNADLAGTVTSVATSGTVNGVTLTGGTITSTGTIALGGTLAINDGDWSGTDLSLGNGGTGASTAASALANLGGLPATATVVEYSSATTLSPLAANSGTIYLLDCTGNQINVTLPQTTPAGTQWVFNAIEVSNDVVITPTTATINGASSKSITTQYNALTVVSDGDTPTCKYYAIG